MFQPMAGEDRGMHACSARTQPLAGNRRATLRNPGAQSCAGTQPLAGTRVFAVGGAYQAVTDADKKSEMIQVSLQRRQQQQHQQAHPAFGGDQGWTLDPGSS